MLPWRDAIRAPGIVESSAATVISPGTTGRMQSLEVRSGERVMAGQVIARLANPELDFELKVVTEQVREAELMRNQAIATAPADVVPLDRRVSVLRERLSELRYRHDQLVIRAPHEGTWVSPRQAERLGSWMQRGEQLGELVDLKRLRFVAVVTQQQANELFSTPVERVSIRLAGQVDRQIDTEAVSIVPYRRQRLASAARAEAFPYARMTRVAKPPPTPSSRFGSTSTHCRLVLMLCTVSRGRCGWPCRRAPCLSSGGAR
jgi:multidrug resistance efflux pump